MLRKEPLRQYWRMCYDNESKVKVDENCKRQTDGHAEKLTSGRKSYSIRFSDFLPGHQLFCVTICLTFYSSRPLLQGSSYSGVHIHFWKLSCFTGSCLTGSCFTAFFVGVASFGWGVFTGVFLLLLALLPLFDIVSELRDHNMIEKQHISSSLYKLTIIPFTKFFFTNNSKTWAQ